MSQERSAFLDAYDKYRVNDQIRYYDRRITEYLRSARQVGWVNTVLLGLAAASGTIGAWVGEGRIYGLIAAGLSALAAAVTSWDEVIGFSTNAEMFRAGRGGLAHARPTRPRDPVTATDEQVRAYVTDVEEVLMREVRTWASTWSGDDQPEPAETDDE